MSSLYSRLKDGYQKRVVNNNSLLINDVLLGNKKGIGRQVTVAPTGSGKTFMMASVIEVGLKIRPEVSFVWLSHNKQILYQTQNEIMDSLGAYTTTVLSIEQNIQSYGGRLLLFNVQKGVSNKALTWLSEWKKTQIRLNRPIIFIIDEADEGMSGSNMESIKEVVEPILELGFTASFKKKPNEYLFEEVKYKEVIEAGMLVSQIEYQASDELSRKEMMKRAIQQRDHLEKLAESLSAVNRKFIPKMLIQAPARECENIAYELKDELNIDTEEFSKRVVIHTGNSRGLEQVENIENVQYIIGDLMVERGWNCPEAYVLLSTKDSVSRAKGIQLLGRMVRLPDCMPFDEEFDAFNRAYVYISGKHSIYETCRTFTEGVTECPPPKEVEQVSIRKFIVPVMKTVIDELDKDPEDKDLDSVTDSICDVLEEIRIECQRMDPSVTKGKLDLTNTSIQNNVIKEVDNEWNYEQAKKLLIDALAKHIPRGFSNVVITVYQTMIQQEGGLQVLAPRAKMMAGMIRENPTLKMISENLPYVTKDYEWPKHKLVIVQPMPIQYERSLYPKMQLNHEEIKFADWIDSFCKKHDVHWIRNDRNNIRLFKGHYPDFIIFSKNKSVFLEYKGKHLLESLDTLKKNLFGKIAGKYYMVYFNEDKQQFYQQAISSDTDQPLKEIDLKIALEI